MGRSTRPDAPGRHYLALAIRGTLRTTEGLVAAYPNINVFSGLNINLQHNTVSRHLRYAKFPWALPVPDNTK